MDTTAVVIEQPGVLSLRRLRLPAPEAEDVVVDVEWSGVSAGTERLLWTGRMPPFPGMGYPLVPGYESVGRIAIAGQRSGRRVGERVFVPGARCYGDIRPLFGGSASRVVVPGARVVVTPDGLGEQATLFALAATAYHALRGGALPELIVGHGALGRLIARLTIALGAESPPTVWERDARRQDAGEGYAVIAPEADRRRNYRAICDVSGDVGVLDTLIDRLAPSGEIVLAGFYADRASFAFPPAFMREARIRIAAEWKPEDLVAVRGLLADGKLRLDGLITHRCAAVAAADAYATAFTRPECIKMIIDWRDCA